jgi:hypothetical protein
VPAPAPEAGWRRAMDGPPTVLAFKDVTVTQLVPFIVEGTGKVVSDVADGAGKVIDKVADVAGDGVEAVSGFLGDVGQGISDTAGKLNPLKWF